MAAEAIARTRTLTLALRKPKPPETERSGPKGIDWVDWLLSPPSYDCPIAASPRCHCPMEQKDVLAQYW